MRTIIGACLLTSAILAALPSTQRQAANQVNRIPTFPAAPLRVNPPAGIPGPINYPSLQRPLSLSGYGSSTVETKARLSPSHPIDGKANLVFRNLLDLYPTLDIATLRANVVASEQAGQVQVRCPFFVKNKSHLVVFQVRASEPLEVDVYCGDKKAVFNIGKDVLTQVPVIVTPNQASDFYATLIPAKGIVNFHRVEVSVLQ